MSIGIGGRLAARRESPFHIQMAVTTRDSVGVEAQIAGKVVRVFRTDGRLKEGDDIAWAIWVCEPGDEPTGPACIYHHELAGVSFVEVYLLGTPPVCELAAYEFALIDAPTEQPVMSTAQLEEELAEWEELLAQRARPAQAPDPHQEADTTAGPRRVKWWQFWRAN